MIHCVNSRMLLDCPHLSPPLLNWNAIYVTMLRLALFFVCNEYSINGRGHSQVSTTTNSVSDKQKGERSEGWIHISYRQGPRNEVQSSCIFCQVSEDLC